MRQFPFNNKPVVGKVTRSFLDNQNILDGLHLLNTFTMDDFIDFYNL